MIQSVRDRIYQAIVDYCNASQKPVGRARLSQITGYKLNVIDEHIKTLKNIEGRVFVETPGYFMPAAQFPPDRDISVTVLTSGMRKIELGDTMLELSPHEWAVLGSLASGSGRDLAERQDERHLLGTISQLRAQVRHSQQQLGAMAIKVARMQRDGHPDMFDNAMKEPHP